MCENAEISNLLSIRTYLSYYKVFHRKSFGCRNVKIPQVYMNELAYLGLSILELCKTVTCECWYDYVKPKYGKKAKMCYMNTGSMKQFVALRA